MKHKIKLIRVGNLTKTNYKKAFKNKDSYHKPPKNKGIFCFVWPYIEHFLWTWKFKDEDFEEVGVNKIYKLNSKVITYSGNLWCHFIEEARQLNIGLEFKEEWVKVDIPTYNKLFKKHIHNNIKYSMSDTWVKGKNVINPFKRGLTDGFTHSKDHLEVFIEKIN